MLKNFRMIYFVVFILFLLSALHERKTPSEDKVIYNLLLLVLILVAGLRYRVGGDSLAYMDAFNALPKLSQLEGFDFKNAVYDPLWYVFNALIKSVSNDFVFFQIIHAILINSIIFWTIKKYSNYKYWAILFYFIFYYLYFNMEILRASLSVCVFLLSLPYLLKRKWLIYYIFAIIAFLFHSSALILFFIPFLFRKLKLKYYILIFSLMILFTFFITPFRFFQPLYFSERISNRASSYLNRQVNLSGMIMQFIAIIPVIGFQKIRKINHLQIHCFEYLVTPYVIVGFLSLIISGFYRFLNFLSILALVYIVDTTIVVLKYRARNIVRLFAVQFFLLILFSYQFYYLTRDTSRFQPNTRFYDRYLPYYSVFNEKTDKQRENLYFKSMGTW